MADKIHSNTPVIDHNSGQLNNIINATDPAAEAENQRRMEQVPTARRSHENSGQQMPDTEVQVRNGEVVHVEQPNQKTQEEVQKIVQDLCQMTSADSVRALCEMDNKRCCCNT